MNIVFIIAIALAPFGALALAVVIIKRIHNCTYDSAIWFVSEMCKDLIYSRSQSWLHNSYFPLMLKEDIMNLLPDDTKKQWEGVLQMNSTVAEEAGVMEGVAYYKFAIPWIDDNKSSYDKLIKMLGKRCLTNMHCTITDVDISYLEWIISGYRMCMVRYARTASEQDSFRKIQVNSELNAIGNSAIEVHDDELDEKLKEFGERNEYDKNRIQDNR